MKFFVDTADTARIKSPGSGGRLDGVTANPTLLVKFGKQIAVVIREIRALAVAPANAGVAATDCDGMMRGAPKRPEFAENLATGVPLTPVRRRAGKRRSTGGTSWAPAGEAPRIAKAQLTGQASSQLWP